MRIVGGSLSGRPIAGPPPAGAQRAMTNGAGARGKGSLRPTSDRVRESVFNILAHGIEGFEIEGCRVLDLFAGTGALGLEALSRGAAYCLFVEDDADARGLIRTNVEAFELTGVTRIFRRDARDIGPAGRYGSFGLVFCDPPYGSGLSEGALARAMAGGWLADGALVAVEDVAGIEIALPERLDCVDRRTWGDTQVLFARYR